MPTSPAPPRRADALRNRARVLAAARDLVTEHGHTVSMPDIARAAGVGIGTVYRHFPSRHDLIEALGDLRFADIAEFGRELARRPGADRLVEAYLLHVGELLARDHALSVAIESSRGTPGSAPRGGARADLETVIGTLLEHDKAAGLVRPDITIDDVYLIVGGLSATIRTASGSWRRSVELALHGLTP